MSKGCCMNCGEFTNTRNGLCEECRDAAMHPISPKVEVLNLDDEMGKTFRFLAQRHAPTLLGDDPKIRRMLRQDEMNRIAEEFHPLMEVTLISLEEN